MPDDDFIRALRYNAAVFAAFKTHRLQNDVAARLLGDDGQLKAFERWLNDVQDITSHQCGQWLRTEYDTAVLRARQAANWQQFVREEDVLPNLRWVPSTSPNPGEDHRPFWNTILPIRHPFWNHHRPGDRWNCKCDLTATDEPPTAVPADAYDTDPQPGLDDNPATTAALFAQTHPYYTHAYPGAQEAAERAVTQREQNAERASQQYRQLSQDPEYRNVEIDEKTGAVFAEHVRHNIHPGDKKRYFDTMTGDDLEREAARQVFSLGHSIILREEGVVRDLLPTITFKCCLDAEVDGRIMDIMSICYHTESIGWQLRRKNRQLHNFNEDFNETADTVLVYFHDTAMYSRQLVENSIRHLKEMTKWDKDNECWTDIPLDIHLRHIICVTSNGIWEEYGL